MAAAPPKDAVPDQIIDLKMNKITNSRDINQVVYSNNNKDQPTFIKQHSYGVKSK